MDLEKLYQLTILEYSRKNDFKYEIENPTQIKRGYNSNCGDDISIVVRVNNDVIEDISFLGVGCAISTASTNMLIEIVKGKKIDFVKKILDIFFRMMKSQDISEEERDFLENASLLEITKDMPARIKCSTLSWHTLKEIIKEV